jgi:hypothetical protein
VVFIFDGNGEEYARYSNRHIAFSYASPGLDETAFVIRNNPLGNEAEISKLAQTYIVRTRTDAETEEAIHNDYTRFDAAFRSNAQIISTDYYAADPQLSPYRISLERFKLDTHWEFLLRE